MFFKVAAPATVRAAGRSGNCVLCHAPPDFTDFIFHNTGASQADYDSIHGEGAFSRVWIPDLATRQSNYDAYLPPTTNHPYATGRFRMPPRRTDASYMDLGLWNVFDNPDYPAPQAGLQKVLTNEFPNAITADALLQSTIGLVKTPTLRDLGQCQPYLHTGQMRTIEDVIEFDREFAEKARQGKVQNGDPQLKYESVDEKSVAALAAFIRALNEDYTD
jgi:cytochrome c peroxidase